MDLTNIRFTRSQWDRIFIILGSALGAIIFTILVMTTSFANGSVEITDNSTTNDTCQGGPPGIDGCPPSAANITSNANITSLATNPVSSTTTNSIGKGVIIEGPDDEDVFVNFSALWPNSTRAIFSESMSSADANILVSFLTELSEGKIDQEALSDLLPIAQEEATEEEEETEEEDDQGGGSGGGGDPGDDNNNPTDPGSGDPDTGGINPVLGPGDSYDCNGDGQIDRTYPCNDNDPSIGLMPPSTEGGDTRAAGAERQTEPEPEQSEDPGDGDEPSDPGDGDDSGDGGGDAGDGGGTNVAH